MKKFKPGDKVRLISGSEEMIVHAVYGYRLIDCEWVGKEGIVYKNSFRPEYLELITANESMPIPDEISKNTMHQN